jgi:Bacterial CdiA-CT RNAse A domain
MLQIGHKTENSTRFGGVTTVGRGASVRGICVYSRRGGPTLWRCDDELGESGTIRYVKKRLARAWIVSAIAALLCLVALHAVGCGSAPTLSNGGAEGSSPSQTAGSAKAVQARYDLGRDEERGGHTLSRHVARTDAELEERLEREHNISAASTWTNRETAEETVAEALHAERGHVESWTRRGYPRANLALHYSVGRPIGRSLGRGESVPATCTDAVIVLRADGPDSFYVLTAYPEARR